jgi:hypothetical protein
MATAPGGRRLPLEVGQVPDLSRACAALPHAPPAVVDSYDAGKTHERRHKNAGGLVGPPADSVTSESYTSSEELAKVLLSTLIHSSAFSSAPA